MQDFKRYLQYIDNTGGECLLTWFDEDHEPIGPRIRGEMTKAGLIVQVENGDRPFIRRVV